MSLVRDKNAQKLQQRISHWVRALSRRPRSCRRNHGSKLLANPRALDHSRLPPEVWLLILREATYMFPDPLDTRGETSFLDGTNLHLPAYYTSMRFKTNLSLVSKRWNALVKTYLYEFVWISRSVQAKALAHTLLLEFVEGMGSSGRFIRRLHIETPILERCAPADLHVILEYSPQLAIYTDHQSIQRNRYETAPDPRCSPERLLSLLAHPKCELQRLAWTSYDDVPFHERMSPLLSMRTMRLEYLELSSCAPNCGALFAESLDLGAAMRVALPALRSLKANLDNGMFAALASWELPALRNLSVVSADFSYTGAGFFRFFAAHGAALRQLELGHSSSMIEEHYLTSAQPRRAAGMDPLSLARWCPNLRELICSADAEWHWEQPDWIAPHVLVECALDWGCGEMLPRATVKLGLSFHFISTQRLSFLATSSRSSFLSMSSRSSFLSISTQCPFAMYVAHLIKFLLTPTVRARIDGATRSRRKGSALFYWHHRQVTSRAGCPGACGIGRETKNGTIEAFSTQPSMRDGNETRRRRVRTVSPHQAGVIVKLGRAKPSSIAC